MAIENIAEERSKALIIINLLSIERRSGKGLCVSLSDLVDPFPLLGRFTLFNASFREGVKNWYFFGLSPKKSQELRMLSRSLSDCKSLLLNVNSKSLSL